MASAFFVGWDLLFSQCQNSLHKLALPEMLTSDFTYYSLANGGLPVLYYYPRDEGTMKHRQVQPFNTDPTVLVKC